MTLSVSLLDLLRSDLERHYEFSGRAGRRARALDLWRNFVHPRCAPLAYYRLAHAMRGTLPGRVVGKLLSWAAFFIYGIEIDARCVIGPGCYIPHSAGSVLGARAIGAGALIYQQVTLGAKVIQLGQEGRPVIGDNVVLGAGAKVLGDITIGHGVVVGPNSLVMESLPDRVTVLGVPAQIVKRRGVDAHG